MSAATESGSARRRALFQIAWTLAWPLRTYLRLTPAHRGRGLVEAALVRFVLPLAPETFLAPVHGGGTVALQYRERIGLSTLLYGPFEAAETVLLCGLARRGSTAVDVGANVGVFTVPLALAVGAGGCVLAVEPAAETAGRLRENARRNGLRNVRVVAAAVGAERGTARLLVHADSAYNATVAAAEGDGATVDVKRLDDVWDEAGRPEVSVLKVDVEGAELDVLAGSAELIGSCRPAVLVEAADPHRAEALSRLLAGHDYRRVPAAGLQPWNLLFLPRARDDSAP